MRRADFLKRAGLLLLAPTAARAINFGEGGYTARLISPVRTITLAPGGARYFKPMNMIHNELTGELMRITAIDGDTLTVAR